jgi:hypothetical protein
VSRVRAGTVLVLLLVVTGAFAWACHPPEQPPVPPSGPLNPTAGHAASNDSRQGQDDTMTDASIASDARATLDSAAIGFDSAVPERH